MKTIPQKFRQAPVAELTPHPENPRQGDVGAIHTSIEANGFYGAIIVQKSTGRVLAGNHRLQAAVAAGASKVPIIEVDVDDDTALKILLADNRTNDLASYDNQILTDLLTGIAQQNPQALLGTGYDGDDLDDLLASLQETGFPNADGNVGRLPTIEEKLDKYENSSVRSVVLEYPLAHFRWMVDALAALRQQYGMEANGDVVLRLVEGATGEKAPDDAA